MALEKGGSFRVVCTFLCENQFPVIGINNLKNNNRTIWSPVEVLLSSSLDGRCVKCKLLLIIIYLFYIKLCTLHPVSKKNNLTL